MKTLIVILTVMFSLSGCVSSPSRDEKGTHYFSPTGEPIVGMDKAYSSLKLSFGPAVPEHITVVLKDFPDSGAVLADYEKTQMVMTNHGGYSKLASMAVTGTTLLTFYNLSAGATATKPYEFLAYGFGKYLEWQLYSTGGHTGYDDVLWANYYSQVMRIAKTSLDNRELTIKNLQEAGTYTTSSESRALAASFMIYLVGANGTYPVRDIVKTLGDNMTLDEAFRGVLGKDAATVEKEWQQYVSNAR